MRNGGGIAKGEDPETAQLALLAQAYLTGRPISVNACIIINCRGRLTTRGTKGRPASKLKGHSEKKRYYRGGVCKQDKPSQKSMVKS